MQHHAIKITAFDRPMPTVRRQVTATNVGIYCRCGKFIAFSVTRGEPRWNSRSWPIDWSLCCVRSAEARNIATLRTSFNWFWTRRTFGDRTDIRRPLISVTFLASSLPLRGLVLDSNWMRSLQT